MPASAVVVGLAALAVAGGIAGAASPRPVIAFGSERGGPVRIVVLGVPPGKERFLQQPNATSHRMGDGNIFVMAA